MAAFNEYKAAATHPKLIWFGRPHQLEWYERIQQSEAVRDQIRQYFGGSTDLFDLLVDRILNEDAVLALGDREVSALHPVIRAR